MSRSHVVLGVLISPFTAYFFRSMIQDFVGGLVQQPLPILFLLGAHSLVQLGKQIGISHIHQLLLKIVIASRLSD